MKTHPIAIGILASALLLPLTACSQSEQDGAQPGVADGLAQAAKEVREQTSPAAISAEIQKGIQQARKELATEDISVNNVRIGHDHERSDNDSRPKAVITPQGNLLIAGKEVSATPEQHAMLVDYRQQIIGIAEAGMDIGANSASLGVGMARKAILGSLLGSSDKEIEASIKPQTDKIKAAALQLCGRMPGLLASQQKLAAAMAEFRPYATMTQKDVDDCGEEMTDENGKKGFAVFSD
ncbi:hypothetical protein ASG87_18695 [Frateuria sp. Soil773]|uniref:hypothetical protein n=1 Tax=Frateuria sp. Soil773 TaxID=1736407 RepID=UPI0006F53ADA|nr:hypothetical protein [Frateuria sp. Soil773]KRE90583.1 hypothetical protein ASG87_18695 [Frateuria sp. Soil773]